MFAAGVVPVAVMPHGPRWATPFWLVILMAKRTWIYRRAIPRGGASYESRNVASISPTGAGVAPTVPERRQRNVKKIVKRQKCRWLAGWCIGRVAHTLVTFDRRTGGSAGNQQSG
jgi:hypothetical protein